MRGAGRRVPCGGGRFDEWLRRSLLDLGEAVVGWMTLVVVRVLVRARLLVPEAVMMLEVSEGIEVVAVVVHQSLEGDVEVSVVVHQSLEEGVEAAVVEDPPSLGEVSELVEV